ncbi:DoxX-like family protein [Chitinophaga hostae]
MKKKIHRYLNIAIAAVWMINGLYCKVLNGVPRHQQIVARILGADHAAMLTRTIGWLEVLMAAWVLSNVKSRWCALTQILLVATMNIIEFLLVPDLLLFGRINIVVAAFFIFIIYWNQFRF